MREIRFDDKTSLIDAGFEEEENVLKLTYDISELKEDVGEDGELSIRLLKPGYKQPIVPINVLVKDNIMEWVISASETEYQGYGMFQLTFKNDSARKKSKIFQIRIYDSLRSYQ